MNAQKPHIILIMADQHRADALGCAGNSVIKTPNLDYLANEGVIFSNAYSSTPSCTPARAALLTGLSPWNHGMLGYFRLAKKYRYEMPQMLRNSGYYTYGIGKMHWYPQRNLHGFHGTLLDESGRVESKGFVSDYRQWFKQQAPNLDPDATGIGWNENRVGDYVLDENLHPTAWTGSMAIKKIKEYQDTRPLFLKVSFARPHSPYDAPLRFVQMYNWESMPPPLKGNWIEWFKSFKLMKNAFYGDFGLEFALRARRHYYANVTFIDEWIGKIIAALKEKGMYENSLIIYTADHGDMLGDHYHWRKAYAYEGSAKIPMILKWPSRWETNQKRGTKIVAPVELRDILPTFLDACGISIPQKMDGKSLLTLVREQSPSWREFIDLEHATTYDWRDYWMGLTDGKIKYIYFRSTGKEQLFNLEVDPEENIDLSSDPTYSNMLNFWRSRLISHLSIRGKKWVKNGRLQKKTAPQFISPHFPDKSLFFFKFFQFVISQFF